MLSCGLTDGGSGGGGGNGICGSAREAVAGSNRALPNAEPGVAMRRLPRCVGLSVGVRATSSPSVLLLLGVQAGPP